MNSKPRFSVKQLILTLFMITHPSHLKLFETPFKVDVAFPWKIIESLQLNDPLIKYKSILNDQFTRMLITMNNPINLYETIRVNHQFLFDESDFRPLRRAISYLIVASNTSMMIDNFYEIYFSKNYNASAIFVFVLVDSPADPTPLNDVLLKLFVKVFVIVQVGVNCVTFHKAQSVGNCFQTINVTSIDVCENNSINDYAPVKNLLTETTFHAINACPMIVFDVHDPPFNLKTPNNPINGGVNLPTRSQTYPTHTGALDSVALLLFSRLQLNVTYEEDEDCFEWMPKYDVRLTGYDGKKFMCLAWQSLGLYHYTSDKLDFIFQNRLVIAVKPPGYVPLWRIIFYVLSQSFWAMAAFILALVSVLWWVVKYPTRRTLHQFIGVLTNLFASNLSVAIDPGVEIHQLKMRFLFIAWLIYTMHFVILFQAKYTNLLTNRITGRGIATINQLAKRGIIVVYVYKSYISFLDENDTKMISFVKMKTNETFANLIRDGRAVLHEYNALHYNERFLHDDDDEKIRPYYLPMVFFTNFVSFSFMIRGSVFREPMNDLLGRFRSMGLITKFLRDVMAINDLVMPDDVRALRLFHLQCPFFIGIIGCAISFGVFILEFFGLF